MSRASKLSFIRPMKDKNTQLGSHGCGAVLNFSDTKVKTH